MSIDIILALLHNQSKILSAPPSPYNCDKRTVFYALSKLSSPFLPQIYEVFLGEDTIVIEEYVEGVTLEHLIESSHCFGKKESLTLLENLLAGLAVLHENGIVHRDIKPSKPIAFDGVVDEETFNKTNVKTLFLLKEVTTRA